MPDNLKIGRMDVYLTAQVKTETKSAKGQVVATWTDSFGFYAKQSDIKTTESFVAQMTVAPSTVVFSTWYRDDLTRKNRIFDGDDYYLIVETVKNFTYMDIRCQRIDE